MPNRLLCPKCHGQRTSACLACGGTGKRSIAHNCKECNGSGQQRCYVCGGIGEVEPSSPITPATQHRLFYMENAGGYKPADAPTAPSSAANEHQPSCFALEEERGEGWKGSGATKPNINEAKSSL
jgi:hypothetical protein